MRLLIATDAWRPQINGVVRSLENMATRAAEFGAQSAFLTPNDFRSFPLPSYREIRVSLATTGTVARALDAFGATHVHIATEGPIGFAARRVCLAQERSFTTSFHTRFPEYIAARVPVPQRWTYAWLRRFHNAGRATFVSSPSLERELLGRGFRNLMRWTRGVDTELFRPRAESALDLPRPIFLFVGRLAIEKNIEAFLSLDLPGTKVIVGAGPDRGRLEGIDPTAHFLGSLTGDALARVYAAADVFVFPSLTDTFGIVLLEALASGLPIAAFPVTGPLDVIGTSNCGVLDADLRAATMRALDIPRDRCRDYSLNFTWRESARQFFANILSAQGGMPASGAAA